MADLPVVTTIAANGVEIKKGSIVKVIDLDCLYLKSEGVVIDPNSTNEGAEYCVAVFFFSHEAPRYCTDRLELEAWDKRHMSRIKNCITGEHFVEALKDMDLKTCLRVVYFQPSALEVIEEWSLKVLADRFYGEGNCHHFNTLKPEVVSRRYEHFCMIEKCQNRAKFTAVVNIWGSVYQMFLCETCYPKYNGMCGDSLPEHKIVLMNDTTQRKSG